MLTDIESFLQNVDQRIQEKHLLKHEFYQAWSRGELTLECLQEYAEEYDHHVRAFPTYLSAAHSHCEDMDVRKILLKNLIEEEAGSPNHPDLWRQFALALGVKGDQHQPHAEVEHLVGVFRKICQEGQTAEAVAALYAYESQIPEICVSKIEGLKKFYGICDPSGWEYFRVHIKADQEHAAEERALLKSLVLPEQFAAVYAAVDRVLDALWNFLSGLCHRYGIHCPEVVAP